jgi:signal peptidase II
MKPMARWLTKSSLRWLSVSALVVLADQASKHALIALLVPYRPTAVMPLLNLLLTFNSGFSFGMLDRPGDWQRWPLAALSVVGIGALVWWMCNLPRCRGLLGAAIALIIGGAAGNLIDRGVLGHVIDFLQIHYGQWSFAVFNVADVAISIGVALMMLDYLRPDTAGDPLEPAP